MGGEKTLRLPWRFKSAHEFLSISGRSVRPLDPVVEPIVGAVVGIRSQFSHRFDITTQPVRDDDARLAKPGDQSLLKTSVRLGISSWLQQNIENVAAPIDGPPQPHLRAVDRHDDFIKVPLVRRRGPVTIYATGEMLAKPVNPFAYGFPADNHVSLGKQILDPHRAEREAMTGPSSVGDDFTGKR